MRLPAASSLTGVNLDSASGSDAGLTGRRLLFARIGWIAMFVSTLLFFCTNLLVDSYDLVTTILLVAVTSVWFAVSVVLFWRKSNDPVILLFSLALLLVGGIFLPPFPVRLFAGISWMWEFPLDLLEFLAQAAFLIFYLFPDGRFVPRWTRWFALGWIIISLDGNLPRFFGALNAWNSPFTLSLYKLLEVGFGVSLLFAQFYRYQRVSSPVQRQQTKWIVLAFAILLVGMGAAILELNVFSYYFPVLGLSDQLAQLVSLSALWVLPVLIPISIGIALLRYHLWDIDLIINRTLVYGVLTISIVATYILVVVGLGTLLQAQGNPGIALLATGLVAVLFQPLRTWLQRIVNRLIYGERDDPYHVLSWLGQRLEATLASDLILPTIVETVALALKLPYAAITLKQGEMFKTAATYGTPLGELLHLPLIYQTEQVGELLLAPRTPGESFTSADRKLLSDLAHQAGAAAHAVRLAEDLKQLTIDLQHSRERLVTAREEERRRLRRDLHDGLGPQLAGLTLKLETARNRLAHDALADTLLSDLTTRTQATVTDIRRLVYALRPPALDELGLLPALREQAFHMTRQNVGPTLAVGLDNGLSIDLLLPDTLPELPAAVEVAIYRIVQEALTNVVRHANARHCMVCLALDEKDGQLKLEVQDDGGGMAPQLKKGLGLNSMRERAEELGGIWAIEPVSTGGTCIHVQIPYRSST